MDLWICLRKVFLLLEKSGVALILRFDNIRKSEQGTPPRPEEAAAQNILPTSQKWAVTEPTIQQMQPMPSAETQENRVRPAPTTLSAELTYFFYYEFNNTCRQPAKRARVEHENTPEVPVHVYLFQQ